jgi:hypothetical protein
VDPLLWRLVPVLRLRASVADEFPRWIVLEHQALREPTVDAGHRSYFHPLAEVAAGAFLCGGGRGPTDQQKKDKRMPRNMWAHETILAPNGRNCINLAAVGISPPRPRSSSALEGLQRLSCCCHAAARRMTMMPALEGITGAAFRTGAGAAS